VVVYLAGAVPGGESAPRLLSDQTTSMMTEAGLPARAGLIVSRKVGGSVVRHRVSRRLRAQLACRLDKLPAGARVVVRALPSAADASSAALGQQLDAAFAKLTADRPQSPGRNEAT
jgi:ribonuclease P protein component